MFAKFGAIVLLTVTCIRLFSKFVERRALNNSSDPSASTKDINQWNVAVVLPPNGKLPPQPPQSGQPPVATSPGFVWLQVPAAYFPNKPGDGQKPLEAATVSPPTFVPPKEETLPQIPPSTNLPAFPGLQQPVVPALPSGGELTKKCLKPTGQFPTSTCNKFINCWNGDAIEQSCPEGLLFNAQGLYCDYPERVDCSQRATVVPKPPHVTVISAPVPTVPVAPIQTTPGSVPIFSVPVVQTTQIPPVVLTGGELNKRCLQPRGQFPSDVCNKFLNCWDGTAVEQFCPNGLLFNPSKLHCDYAESVNCNGKPVLATPFATVPPSESKSPASSPIPVQSSSAPTTPGASPSTASPPTVVTVPTVDLTLKSKCLKPRGVFPSTACNKYINCWDDIITEQECPEGFLFSTKGYCDSAEIVDCSGRTRPGSGLNTIDSKLECPQESGTFRDKSNCNSYYTCVFNKVAGEFKCPEGLNFNENIGVCDYADRVDCTKDPLTQSKGTNSTSECPLENGTFRDKIKCNSFYTCLVNKVVAKYDCPEGFNFNSNIGVCDYVNRVDCSKEPLIYQGRNVVNVQSLKDANNTSECPLETGTFRDKDRCNSFYVCLANKVVATYDCPEGFNFNDNIGVCDYRDRVDCSGQPLIFQEKNSVDAQSTNDGNQSQCPVDFGTFRDSKNCSLYYTCVSGKIVAKYNCPTGFSFNDNIGVCDYAERVDCTKPAKIFQVKNELPQLPEDFQEKVNNCQPGTMFRLNPQCTAACLCRKEGAEIVQCPAGLAYDSVVDKCILLHLARW